MTKAVLGSKRGFFRGVAVVGLGLVAVAGFFGWQHFYPVQATSGWDYRVAYSDIRKAAALGIDEHGNILVSEELRNSQGTLWRIAPDGQRTLLVDKLTKPDGLTPFLGGHAFSQETANAPVSLLKDGKVTPLFIGQDVQGLKADGPLLYAIEDRKGDGRLLRYDSRTQALEVVRSGLSESESVELCGDKMLYTVKEQGVVRQVSANGDDPVHVEGLKEPTFLLCDERGLWITEDQTHQARLWLLDNSGKLRVILSNLRAPQELLRTGDGQYLLAEGGRDRVLELKVQP
ncbi:hypothetical protein ACIPL1_20450 [Pseudomonas sp. NPDC090202]|uniref:hypothetical protein n=1 Tax=unclassified Pseudomonas TaxID=196821 RepID=UPI0037FD6072